MEVSLGAIESKAEALFARQRIERLTLLSSQLMAMNWLPRVLAASEAANPTIRIELRMESSQPKAASNSLEEKDVVARARTSKVPKVFPKYASQATEASRSANVCGSRYHGAPRHRRRAPWLRRPD